MSKIRNNNKQIVCKLCASMVSTTALAADELKQRHLEYWNDLLHHKFILEMAADSLPTGKFTFYLRQDHMFLKEFCAFLLTAKQKSNDQKLMTWFESLHLSTINEMQMQNELLVSLGISSIGNDNSASTTAAAMASATLNYVLFLRKVSASSSLEVIVSAMAPCPWSYLEIAQKLSKCDIKTRAYRKWVQFYASSESQRQIEELKNNLGRLYDQADEGKKLLMNEHFGAACKHERSFWEMAYNMG